MTDNNRFTFQQWVDAHFDHPYEFGNFLDIDLLPISAEQHIRYITQAFENPESVFEPYSNGQLNQGLWFLAGDMHNLSDRFGSGVSWQHRERCIHSFISLNKHLFAKRCAPETSAYKQNPAPENPLNMICYMWWDIFAFWESLDPKSVNRVDGAFLAVMESCLRINHIAVIEGALHGLSHIPNHRKQVKAIITSFLKQNPELSSELIAYAKASAGGMNL